MRKRKRLVKTPEGFRLKDLPRGIRMKVAPDGYLRVYGNVVTMTGQIKHFGFRVRVNLNKYSGKFYYKKIVATVNMILDNKIPLASNGEIYKTFKQLFGSPWIEVRRIRNYEAGVHYVK